MPSQNSGAHRSLGPYLSMLLKRTPWKIATALGLMVGLGLAEGVGLLMLVPLLQIVGLDVQQGAPAKLAQWIKGVFVDLGLQPTLPTVLALYALITFGHATLRRWHSTRSLALNFELVVLLRRLLYRAMVRADWVFFTRTRLSDFTHVFTTEVERVGAATYQALQLKSGIIVALVYIVLAVKMAPAMTVLVFLSGGTLLLLLKKRTDVARTAGERTSAAMRDLHAAISEHIGGMKLAKSYGVEERHADMFADLSGDVHGAYVQAVENQAAVRYWFDVGSVLVLSVMVYLAVKVFHLSTAEMLLLIFLFARIMPRLSQIQQGYQSFINFLPSFNRVMEMQADCERASEALLPAARALPLRDAVHLEGIVFRYDDRLVIKGLDMIIPAGITTALVGPSGAGKSTVVDLVLGLLRPEKGHVLVDGAPLKSNNLASWRKGIGYVPQETFLFHDSIRANLQWADPEASEQEIWEALRMAAAEHFIARLPHGLDTVVGDRGVRMSGGERQRLALARALLRKPSLLILDEATSDLDAENESRVMQAIEGLQGRLTILLISHRLATVRHADLIYVLEDGKLVESETWEGLMTRPKGRLRSLCLAQGIRR